jgi:diguanylate cyclase (GGDEF)-like protein
MNTNILEQLLTFPRIPTFARKRFDEHFVQVDQVMLVLLVLHWMVATFVTSIAYHTYWYGFIGGGMITLPLLALYPTFKGTQRMRAWIAVGLMLFSVLFIQQYFGRIEMHFHIFVVMGILTLYKDMVPLFVAAVTTLIHHLMFNYLQMHNFSLFEMPVTIFNYGYGVYSVVLHGLWVLIEVLILSYSIKLRIENSLKLIHAEKQLLTLDEELTYTSLHDTLTGLPNRYNLHAQLNFIVSNVRRHHRPFAVLCLDLDHFKNVNDTLGHFVGDTLLADVAKKLLAIVNTNDIVSRIGGDEFIVIVNDFDDQSALEHIIMEIVDLFRYEWIVETHFLRLSASIGVALYPDDTQNVDELLKFADIAMHKAKKEGRDRFCFFTASLNQKIHKEVEIASDMHQGLQAGEFVLYYQPKVDIATKKITGAEALIRWEHPIKGLISPDSFIHIAENTGFIVKLGRWIIKETMRMIRRLMDQGYNTVQIACNVSTKQFQNLLLYEEIKVLIEAYGVEPKLFSIEITESVMMNYLETTLEMLDNIQALGIHICIDDFGTGYSSLSYLQKLPIGSLKIDKSFVDDITAQGDNSRLLVNTIIAMGKALSLHIVAEGVEHEYQMEYLKTKGCDTIQGYYFSKPLCEEDFLKMLKNDREDTILEN